MYFMDISLILTSLHFVYLMATNVVQILTLELVSPLIRYNNSYTFHNKKCFGLMFFCFLIIIYNKYYSLDLLHMYSSYNKPFIFLIKVNLDHVDHPDHQEKILSSKPTKFPSDKLSKREMLDHQEKEESQENPVNRERKENEELLDNLVNEVSFFKTYVFLNRIY